MYKYEKIKNLYKFDQETKKRTIEFNDPLFRYLYHNLWHCSEKIDGANVRIIWDNNGVFEIRGRSDKAELNLELIGNIEKQLFHSIDADNKPKNQTWYGEGCGAGIQKNGKRYGEKHFVGFDIFMHDPGYFLNRTRSFAILKGDGIPCPESYIMYLADAYIAVQKGFHSSYGDFLAEGLVCTPLRDVRDVYGNRIITKIKHRDYYSKELLIIDKRNSDE